MTEVRVDPAALHSCAMRCGDLRGSLVQAIALVEPETIDAARGLSGWSTRHALEGALWRWRDEIERFAAPFDRFGTALRRSAEAYRNAEAYRSADHESMRR